MSLRLIENNQYGQTGGSDVVDGDVKTFAPSLGLRDQTPIEMLTLNRQGKIV